MENTLVGPLSIQIRTDQNSFALWLIEIYTITNANK